MRPRLATKNAFHKLSGNMVFSGELDVFAIQRPGCAGVVFDGTHLIFCVLAITIALAAALGAMGHCVRVIFFSCSPSNIENCVICGVSVGIVTRLLPGLWGALESPKHRLVCIANPDNERIDVVRGQRHNTTSNVVNRQGLFAPWATDTTTDAPETT